LEKGYKKVLRKVFDSSFGKRLQESFSRKVFQKQFWKKATRKFYKKSFGLKKKS